MSHGSPRGSEAAACEMSAPCRLFNLPVRAQLLDCVQFFATLWNGACKAPLSMGFSRQEYWSELPCPPPGDLPNPGITAASLASPALAGGFWSLVPPRIHMCLLIENYLLIEN